MDRAFRKTCVIFFVCLAIFAMISAGSDEEFFLRGNKYYENHDYDNALASYEMIAHKGRAVLYNIGNCWYHKDDYSHALIYWGRAEAGATAQEYAAIQRNKEHLLKVIGRYVEPSIVQKIGNFLRSMMPYCSIIFVQLFFLFCWYLFFVVLCKQRLRYKKMALSCLVCIITGTAAILAVHYMNDCTIAAIIVKKDEMLFAGPDKGFYVLSPVVYADQVIVKETRQGWYKIQYAGNIGWVAEDVIQVI